MIRINVCIFVIYYVGITFNSQENKLHDTFNTYTNKTISNNGDYMCKTSYSYYV
jgi:hypothetical protein